jgi:hypothetical protein
MLMRSVIDLKEKTSTKEVSEAAFERTASRSIVDESGC